MIILFHPRWFGSFARSPALSPIDLMLPLWFFDGLSEQQ